LVQNTDLILKFVIFLASAPLRIYYQVSNKKLQVGWACFLHTGTRERFFVGLIEIAVY